MKLIIQVLTLFDKSDRLKLVFVLLLMLSSGFLEMVGIGLIFPFMMYFPMDNFKKRVKYFSDLIEWINVI